MADLMSAGPNRPCPYPGEPSVTIEHFPETSSLMSSCTGTNYDFSIWSRSSGHRFLMQ